MQRFLEIQLLIGAAQIVTKTVKNLKSKFAIKGSENLFFPSSLILLPWLYQKI